MDILPDHSLIPLKQQEQITICYDRTMSALNATGLYNLCKENPQYQEAKKAAASFIVGWVESTGRANFERNMNVFERCGFLSNGKYESHRKKLGLQKGLAAFAVTTAFDLGPMVIEYFAHKNRVQNLAEYIVGWLAYINGNNSLLIQNNVRRFFQNMEAEFNIHAYQEQFDYYAQSSIRVFPYLNQANVENKYQLFNFILQTSDLNDPEVKEKCTELGKDGIGLMQQEVDEIITRVEQNQELICDISLTSGFSIATVLSDLTSNAKQAMQYSSYNVANNPYGKNRESAMRLLHSTQSMGGKFSSPTIPFAGQLGPETLQLSKPAVYRTINSSLDISKGMEIIKRMKQFDGRLLYEQS